MFTSVQLFQSQLQDKRDFCYFFQFDGQRSSEELRKFWQNYEHPSINKKEWTEEETERLKKIAAEHGYLDWQTIAQELGVRCSEARNEVKNQLVLT